MNNSNFNRALDLCVAVAFLAGCGAPQAPLVAPGLTPPQARMRNSTATAIPELRSALKSQGYKATPPLLYATNVGNTNVTVYRARAKDPGPLATITDGLTNPFGA